MKLLAFIAIGAAMLLPCTAYSQGVQRPQRPYRGLFGGGPTPDLNRSRQELTLTVATLGGYNDFISPGAAAQPSPTAQGGYSGLTEGTLRYWKGRSARSGSIDLRGATLLQDGFSVGDSAEGSIRAEAVFEVGRSNRLNIGQDLGYEPTLALTVGDVPRIGVDAAPLPGAEVSSGVINQRSWFYNTNAQASRTWTARHVTAVSYTFSRREYLDDLGFDTSSHGWLLRHNWNIRRSLALSADYRASDVTMQDMTGVENPVRDNALQLGVAYTRRLSPSRQIRLSLRSGATHISRLGEMDRLPVEYWMPVAEADGSIDIGRSWSISGNYRRSVNVLPGLTLQSFSTDAAALRASGTFGSRIEAALAAGFANGRSGASDSSARFENYTGTAQFRLAITRWCAASLSYDYHYYRLRGVLDVPLGLPPEYDREAVRVGFTFWLPLYGSYARGGRN